MWQGDKQPPTVRTKLLSSRGADTTIDRCVRKWAVASLVAVALKVPLNRGKDHATMCAPHLPTSPRPPLTYA